MHSKASLVALLFSAILVAGCTQEEFETAVQKSTAIIAETARTASAAIGNTASAVGERLSEVDTDELKDQLGEAYDAFAAAFDNLMTQTGLAFNDLFGEPADKEADYKALSAIKGCENAVPIIEEAAERTKVSPNYLLALAKQESGCRSDARAGTTTAVGMFQFVEATWLGSMREHGGKYGYPDMASSISTDDRGRHSVNPRSLRPDILRKRNDAQLSAYLAAELALTNARYIQANRQTKTLTGTDLYMAHFLGPYGARLFLNEMDKNPNSPAYALLPSAAKSNPSVFYVKANKAKPRSFAEVYRFFQNKIEPA